MNANEIRGMLIIKGTSANKLASKIGVTRQAMYQTISGTTVSEKIRTAIAEQLDMPVKNIWPDNKPANEEAA